MPPEAAQAAELVRALRAKLNEMTARLDWVERQAVTSSGSLASVMRSEAAAAALRLDIDEALVLINRLQRRYQNLDQRTQQHPYRPQPKPRR
jgi:small-conductance mechanosensitive channel